MSSFNITVSYECFTASDCTLNSTDRHVWVHIMIMYARITSPPAFSSGPAGFISDYPHVLFEQPPCFLAYTYAVLMTYFTDCLSTQKYEEQFSECGWV